MKFLTKENISLFIAIAGFVLSIFNIIRQYYFNRAKINIIYRSHYCGGSVSFNLAIENCSQLDISISRMLLIVNNKEFEFLYLPKTIWTITHRTGGVETDRKKIDSISFPQTIGGLGAVGGCFAVDVDKETCGLFESPVAVALKVFTNRGCFLFPVMADNNKADI